MSTFVAQQILFMPEVLFLLAATAVLLISLFSGKAGEMLTYVLSVATLIVIAIFIYTNSNSGKEFMFSGMYINDELARAIKLFVCIAVVVVFIYARPYLQNKQCAKPEFYILGLFATLGMLIMASAHNFILIYLGLELLSLSLYALVAYRRDSSSGSEAAIKYFVLGAIASGLLLYGMSILYGLSGTLDLYELTIYLSNLENINIPIIFALTFVVVGIAFKFGAVPFHMWVPDVYHGAPTAVTLFIATAPKLAAFAMALRLLNNGLQELVTSWQSMLLILAVLSLIFGNVIAIAQTNIKRMLAYSTIAHVGFILLGLATGQGFGYAAALFYTVVYVLMAAGAFGVLLLMCEKRREVNDLSDLKGLSRTSPWFALIMLLFMFSMAGVPLTIGFYAKLNILQSLVNHDMLGLAIVAVVMSIVGAFYYLRVVKYMYFDDIDFVFKINSSKLAQTVLSINGLLVVLLFIFPNELLNYCLQAIT